MNYNEIFEVLLSSQNYKSRLKLILMQKKLMPIILFSIFISTSFSSVSHAQIKTKLTSGENHHQQLGIIKNIQIEIIDIRLLNKILSPYDLKLSNHQIVTVDHEYKEIDVVLITQKKLSLFTRIGSDTWAKKTHSPVMTAEMDPVLFEPVVNNS